MTQADLIGDVVAKIRVVDELVTKTNTARADRDRAICAALDDGVRPSQLKRATGISLSMLRVIRQTAERTRP